ELKGNSIYHKSCLKCSVCNIQLDLSTFGSINGVIYCKVHLKAAAPEMAKVAFDPDAPLTGLKRVENVPKGDTTPINRGSFIGEGGSQGGSYADARDLEDRRREEEERKREESREESREEERVPESPKVERREVKEEEPKEEPQETKSEPEVRRDHSEAEAAARSQPSITASKEEEEEAERKRRLEERRREREEKKRQQEEEEAREERERQAAREERRKRLESAKDD
ncbi:hypothetical protein PROFUN_16148, partial [Planoprotostelium fungivorum]